jgi:hypothetical protein
MRKKIWAVILLPAILLIMGCPVNTAFPIAEPGTEKIDKALIGTWLNAEADSLSDVISVSISKKDQVSYDVEVLENGPMYMVESTSFEGFVTKLEGETFFYVRPVGKDSEYYLYHYRFEDNLLKTYDVGLKVGGIDSVTSIEAFRAEVTASMKLADCLSGEIRWTKVKP